MLRQMQQRGWRAQDAGRGHRAAPPPLRSARLRPSSSPAAAVAASSSRRPLQQATVQPTVVVGPVPTHHQQQQQQQNNQQQQQPPPPSASGRMLVDPAHLCVRASATTPVLAPAAAAGGIKQQQQQQQEQPQQHQHAGEHQEEGTSLNAYMTLPVTQYYCLDPDSISFLGGDRFRLSVGRVALPKALGGAWVEPTVDVRVRGAAASGAGGAAAAPAAAGQGGAGAERAVVLEAERCRLRASPALEALRLDEKFALRFKARLTWRDGGSSSGGTAAATNASESPSPRRRQIGEIRGDASVDVYCEVLAPFRLVPRQALEAACSSVLASLARALLPVFLAQLSADFTRWAGDPAYRQARRARAGGAAAAGGQHQQQGQQQQQRRPLVAAAAERVAVR
jgi:hypothetical protein